MTTALSDDAKAILLLCAPLEKMPRQPLLSTGEYNRLALWLNGRKMRPADLFVHQGHLARMEGFPLDAERVGALLDRGVQMAMVIEELDRGGIEVCCRSDDAYPVRYRERLGHRAPPFFFYIGSLALAGEGGLAVTGLRGLDAEGEKCARQAGVRCAEEGVGVISGGAGRTDTLALVSALEHGGTAVGVISDGLRSLSLSRMFRRFLGEERLLLLSVRHPDAGFDQNADPAGNRLVCGLADAVLVVCSGSRGGKGRSAAWEGAVEELAKPGHIPLFVRETDRDPGCGDLLGRGALPWPEQGSIRTLFAQKKDRPAPGTGSGLAQGSLLSFLPAGEREAPLKEEKTSAASSEADGKTGRDGAPEGGESQAAETPRVGEAANPQVPGAERPENEAAQADRKPESAEAPAGQTAGGSGEPLSLYDRCLPCLLERLDVPRSLEELLGQFSDVRKGQLEDWLKRAVQEGKIRRRVRPVRYCRVEETARSV